MNKYHELSDVELIAIYQNENNLDTIGELFKRYKHVVFGISLKYLKDQSAAEDALMEIFEELVKTLKKVEVRLFKPWIGTVTRNFLHRKFKVDSKYQTSSIDELYTNNEDRIMELSEDNTLIYEKTEIELKEANLNEAINELNKEQALCIKLFFLDNRSYVEICETTGYSFKEVKSFIQNGKRNLKNRLEN